MKKHLLIGMLLGGALGAGFFVSEAGAQPSGPIAISQHTETVAALPPVPNQLLVNVSAGATLNAGNTEAYAANAGGRLGVTRHPHQLTIEALGTLGYAKNPGSGDVEQTSANVLGRARYDLFLSRMDALFIAVQPRRDTFAGLELRLQNQIGYLRNLYFPADSHRLWTELGYDATFDMFTELDTVAIETNPADILSEIPPLAPGQTITRTSVSTVRPGNDVVHSGRVFLGYTNALYAAANLNLGVETLFDVEDKKNVRVTGVAEITTSLTERFKLGVQSRLLFDNVPVPGKKKTDSIIAVQLVYTYDSAAGAQATAPAVAPAP